MFLFSNNLLTTAELAEHDVADLDWGGNWKLMDSFVLLPT